MSMTELDHSQAALSLDFADERDEAIARYMRRHGIKGDPPYDLIELYDLGYDHGGTMEATFPS